MRALPYDAGARGFGRGGAEPIERRRSGSGRLIRLDIERPDAAEDRSLRDAVIVSFVPLGCLAENRGTNLESAPVLHPRFGYDFLLGKVGCVVAILVFLFRSKRWL